MSEVQTQDDDIPAEIDFSKGVRGLHHIPPDAKVTVPTSIERQPSDNAPGTGARKSARRRTSSVSSNESRIAERYAFFRAYDQICGYCGESLDFDSFEIEHVIPSSHARDVTKWRAILTQHGLPDDFDVNSDANRMASCGPCNRRKGSDLLLSVAICLEKARKKAPEVQRWREACITHREQERLIAGVHAALDQNPEFWQTLYAQLRPAIPSSSRPHPLPWPNDTVYRRTREVLGADPTNLLDSPQTTAGHWFPRPELDEMVQALETDTCQLTALLGPPGGGKSALLARLGAQLKRAGHALLALKADRLPAHIASIRGIDEWLDTPESLPILLERLAIDTRVTILIDQLDALSELMDVHTERLFALISFINRLLSSPTIRVMVSCREFDSEHDLRLRALIHNERTRIVQLKDLEWKSVDQFLREKGFQPDNWSTPARNVLRRPNALNIFVKHFEPLSGKPVFETYQSMLEQFLQESVDRRRFPRSIEALYALAKELAGREELWVPRALFEDKFQQEIEYLHAAGWIRSTPDGLRLGFAHQTMFDFIRARSFVSRQTSLFEEVQKRQDGLAIRPTLWSAASYLRTADGTAYRREIGSLLQNREIRSHVKILLIELLGTVTDPWREEAAWLKQLLTDDEIRPHIIQAIAKSERWFALMRTDLMACGDLGSRAAYQASWAIGEALAFDRLFVLETLRNSWLKHPELDRATLDVFRNFHDWHKESAAIIETVLGRTSFDPMWVCKIAQTMAKTLPRNAVQIVRLQLDHDLREAISKCTPRPEALPNTSIEEQIQTHLAADRAIAPLIHLLDNHGDWYELARLAEIAPAELIEGLWTCIEAVSREIAGAKKRRTQEYEEVYEWRFGRNFGSYLARALWSAAEKFALTDPDRFVAWVRESSASEWMPVHQLIVHGLIQIAAKKPQTVVQYILGDSRRLAVQTSFGRADLSRELLAAVGPAISYSEAGRLAAFIREWQPFVAMDADPELLHKVEHWNEDARKGLIAALGNDGQSTGSRRSAGENEDEDSGWGLVSSPVGVEDMAKLSDEEILSTLAQYPDSRSTAIIAHEGGAVELGIAFGQFANKWPERALTILEQLQPGTQEMPAGQGIDAIAKSEAIAADRVIQVARDLRAKGFSSDEFGRRYGWAMVSIANRTNGLDDATISLFLQSLQDGPETPQPEENATSEHESPVFRHQEKKRKRNSILWDTQGGVLPNGNFPLLLAITLGLLRRQPPNYDQLLGILEHHVTKNEDPRVWEALLDYLKYLGAADRTRSLKLVSALLQAHPQIFATVQGVRFVASCHEWFPSDLFENVLVTLEHSDWDAGQRAIGELLMLRVALVPEDETAQSRFACALEGLESGCGEIQLGILRSAAETWLQSRLRDTAHHVLISAIPKACEDFADAIMFAFSDQSGKRVPLDHYTSELLGKAAESPNLLRVSTTAYLIDRLKELLEDNYSPVQVAQVAVALVEANAEEIRNGSVARHSEDLINIALTLQRFPETRAHGTSIFEHLLIVNAYKVSETAKEWDRRF